MFKVLFVSANEPHRLVLLVYGLRKVKRSTNLSWPSDKSSKVRSAGPLIEQNHVQRIAI